MLTVIARIAAISAAQIETTIAPQRFDAAGLSGEEARRLCASALKTVLGRLILEGGVQELGTVRGVYCLVGQLRMMTCYFPRCKLALRGEGEPAADILLMVRSMEGPLVVRQGGVDLNLAPGDFVFLSASVPFEWSLPQGGRIDCGSVPMDYFPVARQALERFVMRPIPRAHPPLKLLITHAAYLLMRGAHAPGEAEMIAGHFRQVLPMVLGYLQDEQEDRAGAHLASIRAFIESQLSDAGFDLACVAAKFAVTPRYVQKLFQRTGTTFSRYVLEQRLETARLMILRQANRPISAIAYETGFGDLSYFNRAFRQRFATTPSALRSSIDATAAPRASVRA